MIEPARTPGGTSLYSPDDLERLTRIRDLFTDGLNLAGIAQVLALETEIRRLKATNAHPARAIGEQSELNITQRQGLVKLCRRRG